MPKYLFQLRLTQEGVQGTIKEGGTARREAVVKVFEAMGGKVEALYYAFGQTDLFVIVDVPDNVTAVAAFMIANAAGRSVGSYTLLITPEEMDQAAQIAQKAAASYRAPGR